MIALAGTEPSTHVHSARAFYSVFTSHLSPAAFQIEPYFASLCLYDAKQGRKISEDFFFDVNEPYIGNLLAKNVSRNKSRGSTLLPDLTAAPLEWLSYPRQVNVMALYVRTATAWTSFLFINLCFCPRVRYFFK